MNNQKLKKIAYVEKILSDKTRMEIVDYIIRNDIVTTSQLLSFSHLSPGTLSFHIKKLKSCNLIIQKRIGNANAYLINKDVLNEVFYYTEDVLETAVDKFLTWKGFTKLKTSEYVKILDLHSDPVRLWIWELIAKNPYITGKELSAITGLSDANVSFHVQKMIKAQIVCDKKLNNQHHYWLNIGHALAFHKTMMEDKRNYKVFDNHLSKK